MSVLDTVAMISTLSLFKNWSRSTLNRYCKPIRPQGKRSAPQRLRPQKGKLLTFISLNFQAQVRSSSVCRIRAECWKRCICPATKRATSRYGHLCLRQGRVVAVDHPGGRRIKKGEESSNLTEINRGGLLSLLVQ